MELNPLQWPFKGNGIVLIKAFTDRPDKVLIVIVVQNGAIRFTPLIQYCTPTH